MNAFRVVILICVCVCGSVLTQETNVSERTTLTVDGVTYSNVTFGTATPLSVSIRHRTGIASVPLAKLPPDLQQRLGYDPQKAAAYQQYLKYCADTKLLLDGRLVEASQVQEMNGTIVANPASVKDNDGRTYKGTILERSEVTGYDIRSSPAAGGGLAEMPETYSVEGYRQRAEAVSGGGAATMLQYQYAVVKLFVKDFFPTNSIGTSVSFRGTLINPIGGYTAWAVARKPSFEEWQKLQKQQ
jgi:hypothetical protein